jgi:hypothetical protein
MGYWVKGRNYYRIIGANLVEKTLGRKIVYGGWS